MLNCYIYITSHENNLMKLKLEEILIYAAIFILNGVIIYIYLKRNKIKNLKTKEKITKAEEEGLFEPQSLHP